MTEQSKDWVPYFDWIYFNLLCYLSDLEEEIQKRKSPVKVRITLTSLDWPHRSLKGNTIITYRYSMQVDISGEVPAFNITALQENGIERKDIDDENHNFFMFLASLGS